MRLFCILLCVLFWLAGCAGLMGEPLRVSVAGLEPLQGAGMEMRFNVKLRIQNPNDTPVEFSGVSLQLDLNGQSFASGVSDQSGVVPRYGEAVIVVPLTVPAFAAVRQAFAFAGSAEAGNIPYEIRGRLAGGIGGGTRFVDHGKLSLPTQGLLGP
ncbi:LEA type 2 family protein [Paraburkholderia silvatlantica]|uniref:LEA14-like dessication related protein n=2 Tax=Paraburkholderia silvatlantica TaxID=321895 RepID=A0ABR6FFB4_9BURK|nr:LEA type 2 family protein [Paraburkholderia silvatlantica]MBB2926118.1 LEA14-like dessication related protein [Paraburkholderia silvatlantica]